MPDSATVTFRAVGDICPGDTYVLGLGVCTATRRNGVAFPFAAVSDLLAGADVLVGNLEGSLSRRMDTLSRPDARFCGESAMATELRRLGFTGVSVANNHVLENGEAVFMETVDLLRRAGLEVLGLRDPAGEYHCKPVIVEARGRKVGILAYNWVSVDRFPEADRFIAQVRDGAVNYTWDRDSARDRARRVRPEHCNTQVLSDIRRLRPSVDHLVVLPHWGFEFVYVPPFGCTVEGRTFVEAGADLVVGIHPHTVQGYERHDRGTVFFSLGNFLFDHRRRRPRPGTVLTYGLGGSRHGGHRFDFTVQSSTSQIAPAPSDVQSAMREVVDSSNRLISSAEREQLLDDDRVYADFERQYHRSKWRGIAEQLILSFRYPFVALVVLGKVRSLAGLVARRLRGERTRW